MNRSRICNALAVMAALSLSMVTVTVPAQETSGTLVLESSSQSPAQRAVAALQNETLSPEERRVEILRIVNENPNDAESWTAYGESLEKLGERDRALLAFTKAAEINPKLYSPWLWIGTLQKRGNPSPDYVKAEQAFRRAITEGAPRAKALNELGVTLALQNKMKEAVDCWKQAIEDEPQWGALYNNLFKGAAKLDNEQLCWDYLDRAIAAEKFDDSAIMQFGEYLVARGKAGRAIEVYEKAVAAHPDQSRIRFYYGSALAEAGKKDDAKRELNESISIAKKSGDVTDVVQAAEWAIFKIDNAKAEKQFQEARKLVFQPQADWAKMRPDLERAVKSLNPLVEKFPEFWNGYFVRGVAYRRLNMIPEAEADLGKVLSLHPDEPNATMELALMKRDQYDFQAAAEYAEKAIKLAPRDPMFAINGGLIMIEAGRCDRAWELYRVAERMVGGPNAAVLKDQLETRCKQK